MKLLRILPIAFCFLVAASAAFARVTVWPTRAGFHSVDSNGTAHALADYKGKIVVLEWNNPECPFVKKHYSSGNIPKQQAEATARRGLANDEFRRAGQARSSRRRGANGFVAQYHAIRPRICSIPTARSVVCTPRRRRRTCSSSTERRAALHGRHRFDRRARTSTISPRRRNTCRRRSARLIPESRSACRSQTYGCRVKFGT